MTVEVEAPSITPRPAAPARAGSRRWIGVFVCAVIILVAAGGVGLVYMMPDREEDAQEPEVVPVNVETWPVATVPELADTLDLSAVVEPEAVVQVAAEVAGRIEHYATRDQAIEWRGQLIPDRSVLEEGQPIAAGEPIVHLNRDLLQAQYDRAAAQFEYDKREYLRILDLYERGTTSRTELDDARTRRDIAKALLAEIEQQLDRAVIRAPISGILNRLPMEVGEYAAPGDPVAEIVDVRRMKVAVDVPEKDVYFFSVGQAAAVLVEAPQARRLTGTITYISELADERTRTSRLEITVDNSDQRLRSGQIVTARLTRRVLHDAIMIPLGSVIPLEQGRVVYVVDADGNAARREVELGFIKGRSVRVLAGVSPGDELIVSGHRYVGPGQPVAVIERFAERP
jgi:membrane fusion protein (multidrug efflux system)